MVPAMWSALCTEAAKGRDQTLALTAMTAPPNNNPNPNPNNNRSVRSRETPAGPSPSPTIPSFMARVTSTSASCLASSSLSPPRSTSAGLEAVSEDVLALIITHALEWREDTTQTFHRSPTISINNKTSDEYESSPPSLDLPLQKSLQMGGVRTLCQLACVSRKWRRVCARASLWERVTFDGDASPAAVRSVGVRCARLESLDLAGISEGVPEDAGSEVLGDYAAAYEWLMRACGHTLRRLRVADASNVFIQRLLWLAGRYCPHLQDVQVVCMPGRDTDVLEARDGFWSLAAGCRRVVSFYTYNVEWTPAYVCLIATAWPELEAVTVLNVRDVSARLGQELYAHCARGGFLHVGLTELSVFDGSAELFNDLEAFVDTCPSLRRLVLARPEEEDESVEEEGDGDAAAAPMEWRSSLPQALLDKLKNRGIALETRFM
eukprot:jgi/Chlat1/7838/Chrsp66S07339